MLVGWQRAFRRRSCRQVFNSFHHSRNPLGDYPGATLANRAESASYDRVKTLVVERLQQIVQRLYLERLDRISVVRRDEDNQRSGTSGKRRHDTKPVEVRHLHIEKQDVGTTAPSGFDRFMSAPALGDDGRFVVSAKEQPKPRSRKRLVVGNDHAHRLGHGATPLGIPCGATCHGNIISAIAPLPMRRRVSIARRRRTAD
jgi:hypothetical protein